MRTASLRQAGLLQSAILPTLLIFSGAVWAQVPTSASPDRNAVQVVNQAITAMGGQGAWSQVSDAAVTGTCTASAAQGGGNANFRWTTQGMEFRLETDTANAGPIFLSAHGKPFVDAASGDVTLAPQYRGRMLPFHLPGLPLTTALNNSNATISFIGSETLNGISANHVRIVEFYSIAKVQGTEQNWWFDPGSGLPLRVEYQIPTQTDSIYARFTWDFSNWSQEGAFLLPHQLGQIMNATIPTQNCTISSVQVNTNPASTLFDAR
jgi:hypothetical protein